MNPSSGNWHSICPPMKPSQRSRALNFSIALASVGLSTVCKKAICSAVIKRSSETIGILMSSLASAVLRRSRMADSLAIVAEVAAFRPATLFALEGDASAPGDRGQRRTLQLDPEAGAVTPNETPANFDRH